MSISKTGTVAFITMCIFNVAAAKADSYAGLVVGPSFLDHSYGTRFTIGGHAGTKVSQNFGLGLYGTYANLGSGTVGPNSPTFSSSVKETILAAELNFYPNPELPFFVGAKIGLGFSSESSVINSGSQNPTTADLSGHNLVVGPAIGTEFPIVQNFSLGAEFNTIFVTSSSSDTIHLVNLLGTASFHF